MLDTSNCKFKKGQIVLMFGHKLKILKIMYNNFGYFYKLSCHKASCCKCPKNLEISAMSEEDLEKFSE